MTADEPRIAVRLEPGRRRLLAGLAALPALNACAKTGCGSSGVDKAKDVTSAVAKPEPFKRIGPEFFGFNYELFEVQRSFWDETRHAPYEEPLELMRAFPGAVYRFPGGTISNVYDWLAGIGDPSSRKAYEIFDWAGPWRNTLGVGEFLRWVRAAQGQAWMVLNLSGRYRKELPIAALQAETRRIVDLVAELDPEPELGVLRWELGNELDRHEYEWRPEKYVARARAISEALRAADPEARIVLMMQEYATLAKKAGIGDAEYNGFVARGLRDLSIEYSKHLYYDGEPDGPPIPFRLGKLCDTIAMLDDDPTLREARIWITEHGRWPSPVKGKSWETQWYKTSTLAAAVSVCDLLIAATQLRRVDSAFVHSIHAGAGPWPLLHRMADGSFVGSAVYWGLRVLREHLLPEVLPTETRSTNQAGYDGGYDHRVTVMTTPDRDRHAVWAVNRLSRATTIELTIPALASTSRRFRRSSVGGKTSEVDNRRDGQTVVMQNDETELIFDSDGRSSLDLPPNAVVAISN